MPKIKVSEVEEKNRHVRACIAKNMELYAMSDEEVAIKLCCTKRTFQNKKKRPETFTLKELRILVSILNFSEEERLQFV